MNAPRLLKRRTVEEIFDDRPCPVPEVDDDDNDAFDDGDDDVVDHTHAGHGEPADKPAMNSGDLTGTDGTDLDGDDE